MELKVISRNVGFALLLNALFMFISALVSVIYEVDSSFSPLFLSAIITSITGAFPLIFVKSAGQMNIKEGLTTVVLSWLLCCLFGMLPYVLYGGEFSIINAWFESVSGYTTTGATILNNVEALPNGLLFWRSSTHWLGGVGVVLFMLLILPSVSSTRMILSRVEISNLSQENFRYRTQQTVKVIGYVYVGLTLLETALLYLAGMSFFDAINHSFSTIATGGFSTKNLSLLHYNSLSIDVIAMVFMLLSGMHFGLLYMAVIGNFKPLFKSPVIKYYLYSMVIGAVLISLNIKLSGTVSGWGDSFRQGLFQAISCGTTTGFANADSSIWPGFSMMLLMFFSFQCGCSGSTAGGVKVDRVVLFFKSFKAQLVRQIHPTAIIPIKMGERVLDKDRISSSNLFIALYLSIIFVTGVLLTLTGIPVLESITSSFACIGNVGPGFGTCGSLGNYSAFNIFSKMVLSVTMLLGRMEIFSLLVILLPFKWKSMNWR